MKLGKRPLQRLRKIWNIDNMANQDGDITHYITLDIQTGRVRKMIQFLVTNIGNEDIVLGYPWMAAFEHGERVLSTRKNYLSSCGQ